MRILIAEDEMMSRKMLQKTLERAGYEVTVVENGRQAADHLCPADGPRLALLDWVMPELDGPGSPPCGPMISSAVTAVRSFSWS